MSETGKVTVIAMNASSQELAEHVRTKLESAVIDDCRAAGTYRSKFKFRYF